MFALLFADDTTLLLSDSNLEKVTVEFKKVADYFRSHKLALHLSQVTVNSDVPAIKFLGIFIDPLLNFKYHSEKVLSKISKSMYFLRAVKHILSRAALKSVYYATVHSHFIYGIHIWSCSIRVN